MSTTSALSRFWGVVALALNSVLQPTGRICGGTCLPFLRLSPPFQIANALGLIYHIVRLRFATKLPFRIAVGVVVERVGLYPHVSEPEGRSFFRAGVFIFGALPTLIKAVAIKGDRVSNWLALGYFVPFVILELIQPVSELPTLARSAEATHRMPKETNRAVVAFGLMAALFALAIHIDLCLETLDRALGKAMFGADPLSRHYDHSTALFSVLAAAVVLLLLRTYKSPPDYFRW
ncbi:MAG: hypothetical protein OHK93_000800 [Ramalina farinacea]|uniref:Uncharacterized protein n=1 Tax=Ramalina farinacea TaxID=258253 RepID=A0AA43TVJ0_9LECA|nr:hypothetical protein [Ramalina farinacea]